MDLRKAKLTGASLDRAQFAGANLAGLNLNATNAVGANLSDVDLRQANLIDARLDGANLTGAKLWETQRTGWSIKGVVCRRAFWDREGEEPTDYAAGEFERLCAEKPLVRLHYPGGVSPADLLALPLILRQLEKEHPDSALRIRSMQDDAGGMTVTITLDDLTGRGGEEVAQVQAVLQAKLRCVEAERDRLASDLVPRLLDLVAASRQMNIIGEITSRVAIGGGTMSGDTYNIHGQAGAVGPNAQAHDNTFQHVQSTTLDLPRLAQELGRLHAAMKAETTGTREQDKAVVAVADAEEAAAKGDGPGALQHLKSAGRWALGVAEKIGVSVAAKAIEKAMGGQ